MEPKTTENLDETKATVVETLKKKFQKSFIIGNFIKTIVFLLVSIAVVGGNFILEGRLVSSGEVVAEEVLEIDYSKENIIPDGGVIRFGDEEEFGIANSIRAEFLQGENDYIFEVDSGKFWGNFEISNANVNFVLDSVVLIPNEAAFDVEFDGRRMNLNVFDGDVYVGILGEGIEVMEVLDGYSDLYMNKLLVPRGTQITINLNKIDERIKALLFSKLVKEFKYSAIPSTIKETDWVTENTTKDLKFIESVKQSINSDIIYRGVSLSDSLMGNFVFWAEENLTFIPEKKNKIIFEHLFSYLNDAIYYASEGDQTASDERWNEFNWYLATLPASVTQSEEFINTYDDYIEWLSVYNPGDGQYSVLTKMLDKKFYEGRDVYKIVNMYWLDVYEGLDIGPAAAEDALDQYYGYLDSTLGDYTDFDFYKDYLTYNNQLFDNLLLRYSTFYKDGYFAIKSVLEKNLLNLYEEGQLKEELAQAFISDKIKYLKRMMNFFFEGEISVESAKRILTRLVEEIDDLMPAGDSEVAVIELFESQLKDIGDFWGYLNSPEYNSSRVYGADHRERYETYLVEKERIWDFVSIQEEILGEAVQEITVEDIENEILAIFAESEDDIEVEVGEIEDVTQRYIPVEGSVGGYPFEAKYDRSQESLIEIYAYGELVSDRAVKIDNLLALLKETFAEFVEAEFEEEEEVTEETIAQRRARLYVVDAISEYGFVLDMSKVSVLDEENAIYRIEGITLKEKENVVVTFDFMLLGDERVKNIFLMVGGEPVVFEGEYSLEELKNIVFAEGDYAVEEDTGGVLR